ncbi:MULTISPECIES: DUF1302 family protein [Pseudomonas aeruginosa group]|uniref:DUF1302 domain-containing protein n=1 Tax=Pseudomonas nitroreducens TaxID=46680 RepID=A0A6G6IS69_PSENT|nr:MULTISPECIES: DUF1302 family protein [Pseudomonas aeruginosa group]KYO75094.1 hypothetical protein LT18_06089 [Pseudomonas aeruginosa]QIE85985.1 DUF1302 domain-containing protein [Pseudomonas nitroreducens]HCE6396366.1 DUF1302 family protein [Pseudomonas aeruginosa]
MNQKTIKPQWALVVLSILSGTGTAYAIEIDVGNPDVKVHWDNTVKYNYANRLERQDRRILNSPNFDDGNRNFDKGTVSNRIDILTRQSNSTSQTFTKTIKFNSLWI